MWKWDQSSGKLFHNNKFVAEGYSGYGEGKNNPEEEKVCGIGPIPAGLWHITDKFNSVATGPYSLVLTPDKSTNTFGRSAFRIHGDSIEHAGWASHGCLILARPIREMIWQSPDHDLTVVE